MKQIHTFVAAWLLLFPTAGIAQVQAQSGHATARPTAQAFAEGAANVSQFAISASQEALKKSLDRKVKRLAEQIIDDYQSGYQYILESAASANLRVPDRLDAENQARLDRIRNASVQEIDEVFTAEVRKAHEEAISLFTEYNRWGDNLRFRLLAGRALPTLKEHYSTVQQLASR